MSPASVDSAVIVARYAAGLDLKRGAVAQVAARREQLA
jgi:hypothetical protein